MKIPYLALLLLPAGAVPGFAHPRTSPQLLPGLLDPIFELPLPSLKNVLSLDLLGDIISGINQYPEIAAAFPGLSEVLSAVRSNDITPEEHIRGLLRAIRQHESYLKGLSELDAASRDKVERFVAGESSGDILSKRDGSAEIAGFHIPPSPAAKHHFKHMESAGQDPPSRWWLNARQGTSPIIYEDAAGTKVMKVHVSAAFSNWGLTVSNTPSYTFVPTTVLGLSNLVKWAKKSGKRVRGGGYRHTWADLYSQDGEVLVSMLDLATVTTVPDPTVLLPSQTFPGNELKVIEILDKDIGKAGKKWVRIGAAVTNEELRRWAVGRREWTLPLNILMVEITFGGSTTPMCHGGGIRHPTLSDLIRSVEYIDANGMPRTLTDPTLLKTAAGSLGLLGIVTHVTLEMDKMTYAIMKPKKVPTMLAIPPPVEYIEQGKVPVPLRKPGVTSAQLEEARRRWEQCALNDYYSEWFWFPYQKEMFVQCWNNTDDPTGASAYPTPPDVFLQWIQGWLGGVMNDSILFRALPGLWQAVIMGSLAHHMQPPQLPGVNEEIRTTLPDAIHFRRGTQNMRVRDLELEIPLLASSAAPTRPDLKLVQKACSNEDGTGNEDDGRESDSSGAAEGNKLGTASIEVLTTMAAVADGTWHGYVQRVADLWMGLRDRQGRKLNIRPHWSKEWDGMIVEGRPWRDHLKYVSYKEQIPEFKKQLASIGAQQGWTLADVEARFSCPLLDFLFFK
ncbi:hypothetical protein BDZ91DRAFT_838151 [Kalaharituber pfeilii]|nr:hypothetical protein BDZ91DRAFT_838151 [Kalaharituber pfeilii]